MPSAADSKINNCSKARRTLKKEPVQSGMCFKKNCFKESVLVYDSHIAVFRTCLENDLWRSSCSSRTSRRTLSCRRPRSSSTAFSSRTKNWENLTILWLWRRWARLMLSLKRIISCPFLWLLVSLMKLAVIYERGLFGDEVSPSLPLLPAPNGDDGVWSERRWFYSLDFAFGCTGLLEFSYCWSKNIEKLTKSANGRKWVSFFFFVK